ncbi:MAG: hypothetical protein M0P19_15050, partial [Nevskia sp.]|nr:hypothetical protein [Nevskia sp.]
MTTSHDTIIKFKPYTRHTIRDAPQWKKLTEDQREAVAVVSRVLPFRVNSYVMDELIDWDNVPDDSIYRLTFSHRDMLLPSEYETLRNLVLVDKDEHKIEQMVRQIRMRMNPHPAGQMTHNVPIMDGRSLNGLQHKYRETVLFFPKAGQTCHAYCTFCFRWPQFVGMEELQFYEKDASEMVEYLKWRRDVTDIVISGGHATLTTTRSL